jgi:hypothetical protein
MLRREWHAQGEQNARGSSMSMSIASLHEIKDNLVSGFEFDKQLYI